MFVFLLPYVCACLWGHVGVETNNLLESGYQADKESEAEHRILADMEWGTWDLSTEEYVTYKLEAIMDDTYEKETLKAQAVLIRTEIMQARQEQGGGPLIVSGEGLEKWYEADGKALRKLIPYEEAAEETDGLYLCYQGEPIQAPYFKISNGKTRDAGEVWRTKKFPYLTSVSCMQDKAAQDYNSETTISKIRFLREIQTRIGEEYSAQGLWEGMQLNYDKAGYVTSVSFFVEGEKVGQMEGETFRHLFGLASASFEVEQTDTQILFHVTGMGHGFGMSQYGANCRAINGETYDQILKDFFFGTELAKIE